MSWLKRKLDVMGKRKDTERRMPRQVSLSQVEQLESRLCLGSLNAPDMGDWTPEDPNASYLGPPEVSLDSSLEEATQVEPDEGLASPANETHSGTTPLSNTPVQPTAAQDSQTLDVGIDANQTQLLWNEDAPSPEETAPHPAVLPTGAAEIQTEQPPDAMGIVSNTGAGSSGEAGPEGGQQEIIDETGTLTSNTLVQASAGGQGSTQNVYLPPWWEGLEETVTIRYDFRDIGEYQNYISDEQKALAVQALESWSEATGGKVQFVHDTQAADHEIMNIGTGELEAFGYGSGSGGKLGLGGGAVSRDGEGDIIVAGTAWLDVSENWDHTIANGNPEDTVDFFTVVGHETGHVLGFNDSVVFSRDQDIMRGYYDSERDTSGFSHAVQSGTMSTGIVQQAPENATYTMHAMTMTQLMPGEVTTLLARASAATASDDAVIAIVDRGGTILGVHVEAGVIRNIEDPTNAAIAAYARAGDVGPIQTQNNVIDTAAERRALAFFAEGAVAKARTAAFFSNGDPTNIDEFSPTGTLAPLTSRLVRFISQTTITQREVQGIASIDAPETLRGPGFVAPIGLGGHFPPEVRHTPPVDLFAIEHTNRDRVPGDASALVADPTLLADFNPALIDTTAFTPMVNIRTVNGNIVNPNQDPVNNPVGPGQTLRFNIDAANLNPAIANAADALREPLSFGEISGLDPNARSRGIATLPGGIPIFRDTNHDQLGETLIGGIGVFFPGRDGFATFEQGYKPGMSQAEFERTNAPKVLEAEFMALIAIGGSEGAARQGIPLANADLFAGTAIAAIPDIDLPFGRLDLVGITLQVVGPIAGRQGVGEVILAGLNIGTGPVSGGQVYAPAGVHGREVPFGYIVPPRASADGLLSAAQVNQIIQNAIIGAQQVRAAVRLPVSSRTRMVFAVTDLNGEVLALFRMQDATIFSIDVAVAKARNMAYYANAAELDVRDQVVGIPAGTAFTNRTFRFLAEPRFPSGVDGDPAGPFSTLNNPFIDPFSGANLGTPQADTAYLDTVLGRNAFNPTAPIGADGQPGGINRNFLDPNNLNNQNGIVFFPGSTPLYVNGILVGGFGVSGDGVDQDDVVTFIGAQGFLPNQNGVLRSDQTVFRDVRLPYQKFLRNPFG